MKKYHENEPWSDKYDNKKLALGFKGYVTDAGWRAPELHPNKFYQRRELASKMKSNGTVLELYAGKGNLSNHVYKRYASKIILVDMDKHALVRADDKLKSMPHKTFHMENTEFIKKKMKNEVNGLALVDFDAFGSPADSMKDFFDNYKIKHSLLVGVTDGSHVHLSRRSNTEEGRAWVRQKYGVNIYPNTRETQVKILDKFMENQGREHDFSVERINALAGETHAVYVGYKLTPS